MLHYNPFAMPTCQNELGFEDKNKTYTHYYSVLKITPEVKRVSFILQTSKSLRVHHCAPVLTSSVFSRIIFGSQVTQPHFLNLRLISAS
jgi:hypothetical protein